MDPPAVEAVEQPDADTKDPPKNTTPPTVEKPASPEDASAPDAEDPPPCDPAAPSSAPSDGASQAVSEAPKCEAEKDPHAAEVSSTNPVKSAPEETKRPEGEEAAAGSPEENPAPPNQPESSEGGTAVPKDPHSGRIVERTRVAPMDHHFRSTTGTVIAYQEPSGRLPPRWTVEWEAAREDDGVCVFRDEWMQGDLDAAAAGLPEGNGSSNSATTKWILDNVRARREQHLELELESNQIVSTLLLYAAMEEALQVNLQNQQQENTVSDSRGKVSQHPPLYYSSNPSSYLKAPTATDTAPAATGNRVEMTPASLAQRVRAGSQWAWKYLSAQQPPPPPPPLGLPAGGARRSLRQPKPPPPPIVPKPNPVQHGGRVAMWWLDRLREIQEEEQQQQEEKEEQGEAGSESEKEETKEPEAAPSSAEAEPGDQTPEKPTKTEKAEANKVEATGDDGQQQEDGIDDDDDDEEEEDESEPKNDDDDDYGSKDADMEEEDEELEGVEKERQGNLSPVPDDDDDDEAMEDAEGEDSEEEEEVEAEEDIEHAVLYENPFLQPSFPDFLEYLARPRSLSGESVQIALCEAILRVKFNKRSSANGLLTETLKTVDELVLDQETPDYPPGKVVLKCNSEETFGELQKMEAQTFSRCKFSLDVIGDQESSMQVQRKQELILQEIQFKEQKAWDKWRHKGMHEGFTTWPSWNDAITKWVEANCNTDTAETANDSDIKEPITSAAPTQQEETKNDEALAKSLEESEAGSGRRRTARRAAASASEGVFYGNQSQLTQKQLMDALVRLIKNNKFQTLLRLQSLVADDSSDPIRKSRIALGKLVWKRGQLLRKSMDSQLSDASLVSKLRGKPLLTIEAPQDEADEAVEKPIQAELSEEEKDLIKYIQGLHETELQLRRLVTKNMSEIPVAIIASAADERSGSTEAMDAVDFEDQSSIEWHTSGHDLIKKIVFRPASTKGTSNDMTPCFWYEIQDFSKSIDSEAEDKEEPDSKERRMRFRAVPIPAPGESWVEQDQILILTEAQVNAGMKAAEIEKKNRAATASDGNPFSGASGDRVTLIPVDDEEEGHSVKEIHGRIVGYDNIIPEDDDEAEYRILFLPDATASMDAFWASLDVRADTSSYVCQPVGESTTWYSIEQFDYHQNSQAYQQCEVVLNYLNRQSKIGPFLEPVDPVALNIPTYTQVVKTPMDVSTITQKLENGQYGSILPGQTIGNSPVSKMLNGPFRKDIELMFDNAMLFNPPDDWIYQAAAQLKKNALKKIADLSQTADQKQSGTGRFRQKRSVYVDEDSDVDMYEYESDQDEDFDGGGRRSRKRKRSGRGGGGQKDEFAARAIEHPVRLQNTLRDASTLRGPFANLPVNSSASSFSLPSEWSCRFSSGISQAEPKEEAVPNKRAQEMAELLALQRMVEENESSGLRRSTRAQQGPSSSGSSKAGKRGMLEYFLKDATEPSDQTALVKFPSTRLEVEVQAEKRHEEHFAKLYQAYSASLSSTTDGFGAYSNGSFPPYMGRVVPVSGWEEVSWEIRSPFVVPALRWVLRGLIQSGHLTAVENMTPDASSGVLLTNDIYYWDSGLKPFEVLDSRERQRMKRANKSDEEDSEDEVEMSEYEKARAERVARNAERLKLLGLA